MAGELRDRRAVVTGGAGGLGRAIARELVTAGAAVTIIDLPSALEGQAPEHGIEAVGLDLLAGDAETMLAQRAGTIGPVDILVANAGVVPPWRRISDLDLGEWDRVFAINVRAIAMSLKVFAPRLAQSSCGSAILMASINGYRAHPMQAAYTASKHAVLGLMRAAALDMGKEGTRVNALAPGPVLTDALTTRIAARHAQGGPAPEEAVKALTDETALGRVSTEQDIARAALFLASDAAAGITGVCLPVECGLS
ncbi:SDR family oxidoreductase [Oricola sp.]|uniref:SDR family NAD(P)-dependent oxidoreductase n=1 Tax=Oricola sp. TaxID=1979950 RepID=UPI0025FCDC34|nr:SDR family oxidoreductase [Oricola sp.]